jgi:hypothetical protein
MHTVKLFTAYIYLAVCFFCQLSCFSTKRPVLREMNGIMITAWIDIADSTGEFVTWKDTTYIYYKNNHVLYLLPYHSIDERGKGIPGKSNFTYFAHKKGMTIGLKFKLPTDIKGTVHNVDSFTKSNVYILVSMNFI